MISMNQQNQFVNFIFQTGVVASESCSRCQINGLLCIVSTFSTCCGLCLRAAHRCSFLEYAVSLSTVASNNQLNRDRGLRSDLRRAVAVIHQISEELNVSSSFAGPLSVRRLEPSLDKRGLVDSSHVFSSVPYPTQLTKYSVFPFLLTLLANIASTSNSSDTSTSD